MYLRTFERFEPIVRASELGFSQMEETVPRPAPNIRIHCRDRNGKKVWVKLSNPPGPVLLNFWETWCGHCIDELPDLEKIHREFRTKGLFVVGVSEAENYAEMMETLKQKGVTFCQVHDKDGSMIRKFNLSTGRPRTFLIDKRGVIQANLEKTRSYHQFRDLVRKVLPTKRERVLGRAARD